MNYDVIIIGAGVSGLLTAIELTESGAHCCLLDKGLIGQESSWAGGGILSPLYPWNYPPAVTALATWSQQHYPDYFARLQDETGIDPQYLSSGHLILGHDKQAESIAEWAQRSHSQVDRIEGKELATLEPALSDHFDHALWLPRVGQVRNPRFIKALTRRATQLGITLIEKTKVVEITRHGSTVTGIATRKNRLSAAQTLISSGAWSALPLGDDIQLPEIEPVKGQMIQFQTTAGSIRRISLYRGHYIIPRQDGKVLAGSTLEYTGYDKSTDDKSANALRDAAIQLYPSLQDQPVIDHWAGLRPGNKRQIPYICPHPRLENLYFNTGHFRNGIVLGLASARLCADLMLGRMPILNAADYAIGESG